MNNIQKKFTKLSAGLDSLYWYTNEINVSGSRVYKHMFKIK